MKSNYFIGNGETVSIATIKNSDYSVIQHIIWYNKAYDIARYE